MERLQKFIARCGIASRRKAEELIASGQVMVNGRIVREAGVSVGEADQVMVGGKIIKADQQLVYYVLNKPKGVITTSDDEKGRQTVLHMVPKTFRVVACGRLDAASRGLVLLTNDGDLCFTLTHPSAEHEKEYKVVATINKGPELEERINRLISGVKLEDGQTAPTKVTDIKRQGNRLLFTITLHEGKNRQIRRMCSAVGLDVVDLVRTRLANLTLGDLPEGKWRQVRKEEIL